MKVWKKIVILVCCVSITLAFCCVGASASSFFIDTDYEVNGYVGTPFQLINHQINWNNYEMVSSYDNFGALSYDEDYTYSGLGNLYDTTVRYGYEDVNLQYARASENVITSHDVASYDGWWLLKNQFKVTSHIWGVTEWSAIHRDGMDDYLDYYDYLDRYYTVDHVNRNFYSEYGGSTLIYDDVIDLSIFDNIQMLEALPQRIGITHYTNEYSVTGQSPDYYISQSYFQDCRYFLHFKAEGLRHDAFTGELITEPVSYFWYVDGTDLNSLNLSVSDSLADKGLMLWYSNNTDPLAIIDASINLVFYYESFADYCSSYDYIRNFSISFTPTETDSYYDYYLGVSDYWYDYDIPGCRSVYLVYSDAVGNGPELLRGDFDDAFVIQNITSLPTNMLEWLGDTLAGFFDVELFGSVSLADILYIVVGLSLTIMVLKYFAGG